MFNCTNLRYSDAYLIDQLSLRILQLFSLFSPSAPSKDNLLCNLATILWLFTALRFIVNLSKSVLVPTTQLDFLGFLIDSNTMSIALPPAKIAEILKDTSRLLQQPSVLTKALACILGKLAATKPAVPTALLHYRALQSVKIAAIHVYQEICTLSPEAIKDLMWWKSDLPYHCSSPILKPEASIVITSDASLQGWGAACQHKRTGGPWTVEEAQNHINFLELKATYLAFSVS